VSISKEKKMLNIAKLIDHSLLRPDVTEADVLKLCEEAGKYNFHSVCVHPYFVKTAREALFRTHVKVATVIGFPLGMTFPQVKIYEAMEAVLNGAEELDIVMNIGLAKSDKWDLVEKEISDIITVTSGVIHKIIIETCYLTDDEKKRACSVIMNAGAEFVKTSTGFGTTGATVEDVKLIKSVTKGKIGIKASGGIKTLKELRMFVDAGATRIGTSSGVKIMKELEQNTIQKSP
jgi:deoxyribose-phosphate aldolase